MTPTPQQPQLARMMPVEDYHIYRSDLPESGTFNLLLVIKYKNSEATKHSSESAIK
jgi:hypothetical protein